MLGVISPLLGAFWNQAGARGTAGMHGSRLMACVVLAAALVCAGTANAAGPVQLKSRLGNWCLDGPSGNNTAAVVNPCDGSKSQSWLFNTAGQIESVAFPGYCASIRDASDNTPVTLAACRSNANNLQWNREPDGQLISALGPCLNVFGGVAQPGTPVIAYHCIADVDDEKWDSVP
jgi:hypothetical protein